jgi:glycosyltransferase involved in cell wall biosynthesis
MKKPFFSIILPTFNREQSIQKCIKSVLNQSFEDFELIIIDNKSTDNTLYLIEIFNDKRIQLISNDKNYERCYSRNKGIENANGKYITFIDSDDEFEINHLENWFHFILSQTEKAVFFISQKKIKKYNLDISETPLFEYKKAVDFIDYPVIPGQTCFPKKILENHKFNNKYLIFEDTALWLQISTEFNFKTTTLNTYIYVIDDNNSVNISKNNVGSIRYQSISNFMIENEKLIQNIGKNHFNKELSNSLFQTAKYYLANKKRLNAILYIIKSIIQKPSSFQLKHKSLLIFKLILNKKIPEYGF